MSKKKKKKLCGNLFLSLLKIAVPIKFSLQIRSEIQMDDKYFLVLYMLIYRKHEILQYGEL